MLANSAPIRRGPTMTRCFVVALISFSAVAQATDDADTQWPTYGNDPGRSRDAQCDQIDGTNVTKLVPVWTYRTGDLGEGYPSARRAAFEATPILIDSALYFSTPYGDVHAVDAASGERLWHFDAQLPNDRKYAENASRGVSAWRDAERRDGPCALRIFVGTLDARLIALDGATGERCADFGSNGTVDLNVGSRPRDAGDYLVTSPPVIWNNLVITG